MTAQHIHPALSAYVAHLIQGNNSTWCNAGLLRKGSSTTYFFSPSSFSPLKLLGEGNSLGPRLGSHTFLISQALVIFHDCISVTIPENNTLIIILPLVLFPLKTSGKRETVHFCNRVPLGALSGPDSLASPSVSRLSGKQQRPTC